MTEPVEISLGINKNKKSFKPSIKKAKPKKSNSQKSTQPSITSNNDNGIDVNNLSSSKTNEQTLKRTIDSRENPSQERNSVNHHRPERNIPSIDKTRGESPEAENLFDTTELNINQNSETINTINQAEEEDVESTPSSPVSIEPVSMHDLIDFTVTANMKRIGKHVDFGYADSHLEEPMDNVQITSNDTEIISYVDGYIVNEDKVPSAVHKKRKNSMSIVSENTTQDDKLLLKQLNQFLKPPPKDYVPEGLESPSSRKRKLEEISAETTSNNTNNDDESTSSRPSNVVVPQVKIVNGEIQLNLDSLVVDRAADDYQPTTSEIRAPVRKRRGVVKSTLWTPLETQVFYDGLSLYGTDFDKIAETLPDKDRHQVKSKYKAEDKRYPEKVQTYLFDKKMTDP